jgi:hypothetical protein
VPIYKAYGDSMTVSQKRGDAMPRSSRETFDRLGAQQQMEALQRDVGASLVNPAALDDARVYPFLLTFRGHVEDSLILSRQISNHDPRPRLSTRRVSLRTNRGRA